jgi:hypothetical protein
VTLSDPEAAREVVTYSGDLYRQHHHVRRLEKVILCSARLLLTADKKEVAVEPLVDSRSGGVAVREATFLSRLLVPLTSIKTLGWAAGAVHVDGV